MQNPPPVILYTEPQLSTSGNDWYVWFRYYHDGKWSNSKKYREGINRIKDGKEKLKFGNALLTARHDWLKLGWNPIIDPEFKFRKIKSREGQRSMTLNAAFDYALSKKKKLAKKTRQGYSSMLEFIKKVGSDTGYGLLELSSVDRGICLELLDECSNVRNFSNHAYNKYLTCARAMFSVLVDRRIMDINPLYNSVGKEVPESNKFAAFTEDEKKRIAQHLTKVHYSFFVVTQVIYYTGIRPKEALALKVSDIDLKERFITIAPDLEEENSKTKTLRKVPINPHLYRLLKKMGLSKFPGHYYVFGSPFAKKGNKRGVPIKTNSGKPRYGVMRQDYFTPHPNRVKRDTITKLWKMLIMDEPPTGLGIKKHLYAAKHTGADDMVDAGLELKEVQYLYSHESEAMTKRYNKKKKQIEMKKSILDKSPAFTASKSTLKESA